MSSNTFGDNFRVTTFGESHGPAVGVVIDGVRAGVPVDVEHIQRQLDRRRPGQSALSSPRNEADRVEVLSGVFEGRTTGAPIALLVRNQDPKSRHYEHLKDLFRPGHADFTWWRKFGVRDWRGGGRTSGRETVSRVAAGALAQQLLSGLGVEIVASVIQVGAVRAKRRDEAEIEHNPVRCADAEAAAEMASAINAARKAGDSLGGVVEVVARGVPAGLGDPVFDKLDARLGAALLSIGATKGVEFGDGFALAATSGSQSNDPLVPEGFASNHMGGMLGGISNGEPIVARVAVKPTSSIRREQNTIDTRGRPAKMRVHGRHDPCICPRIVPVVEAMVALVLVDVWLRQQALLRAGDAEEELESDPLELANELAFRDAEVLRAIHRRQAMQEAATRGRADGLPAKAEAAVAEARADLGRELGLAPAWIEQLFRLLDEKERT
ncbi:MAG: chorismate synthase [Myxococcales bacterium]|nr:chorismate synthase [Myxococcales bacterium]